MAYRGPCLVLPLPPALSLAVVYTLCYNNSMKVMSPAFGIVAEARHRSGLTQRELAARAGVAQPVVARLEREGANPTIRTLKAFAAAAGFTLRMTLEPMAAPDPVVERYKQDVDRTLLRENLKHSVDERIRSLGEWQQDLTKLQAATKRARRPR